MAQFRSASAKQLKCSVCAGKGCTVLGKHALRHSCTLAVRKSTSVWGPQVNGAENALPFNPQDDGITTESNADATSSDASVGTVEGKVSFIGPYRLLTKIGEGGMGSVWLAQQTSPVKRQVAIKVIKAGVVSGKAFQRFDLERQALAMMDHPTIAKVFDAGSTEDGNPYLVMEYVSGPPLTTYCDRKHLGTRERIELMITVCKGVQHAHQKAIIHRDLKLSNILVTETDGKPVQQYETERVTGQYPWPVSLRAAESRNRLVMLTTMRRFI